MKLKNLRCNIQNCELAIEDYEMYIINVSNNTRRRACFQIHESIEATQIDFGNDYEESVWVHIRLVNAWRQTTQRIIYQSPSGQDNNGDSPRKLLTNICGIQRLQRYFTDGRL